MGRDLQREPDALERLLVPRGVHRGRGAKGIQRTFYPKTINKKLISIEQKPYFKWGFLFKN